MIKLCFTYERPQGVKIRSSFYVFAKIFIKYRALIETRLLQNLTVYI